MRRQPHKTQSASTSCNPGEGVERSRARKPVKIALQPVSRSKAPSAQDSGASSPITAHEAIGSKSR